MDGLNFRQSVLFLIYCQWLSDIELCRHGHGMSVSTPIPLSAGKLLRSPTKRTKFTRMIWMCRWWNRWRDRTFRRIAVWHQLWIHESVKLSHLGTRWRNERPCALFRANCRLFRNQSCLYLPHHLCNSSGNWIWLRVTWSLSANMNPVWIWKLAHIKRNGVPRSIWERFRWGFQFPWGMLWDEVQGAT